MNHGATHKPGLRVRKKDLDWDQRRACTHGPKKVFLALFSFEAKKGSAHSETRAPNHAGRGRRSKKVYFLPEGVGGQTASGDSSMRCETPEEISGGVLEREGKGGLRPTSKPEVLKAAEGIAAILGRRKLFRWGPPHLAPRSLIPTPKKSREAEG